MHVSCGNLVYTEPEPPRHTDTLFLAVRCRRHATRLDPACASRLSRIRAAGAGPAAGRAGWLPIPYHERDIHRSPTIGGSRDGGAATCPDNPASLRSRSDKSSEFVIDPHLLYDTTCTLYILYMLYRKRCGSTKAWLLMHGFSCVDSQPFCDAREHRPPNFLARCLRGRGLGRLHDCKQRTGSIR